MKQTKNQSTMAGKSISGINGANGSNGKQEQTSLLEKFFLDQLKDIYYAEQQLVKALPEMQKAPLLKNWKMLLEIT